MGSKFEGKWNSESETSVSETSVYTNKERNIIRIGQKMSAMGLRWDFVSAASQYALGSDGIYDLMCIWDRETDEIEQSLDLDELCDLIDDFRKNLQ